MRWKSKTVSVGGVKAVLLVLVMVVFFSGIAEASVGVIWTNTRTNDGMEYGDRWSYTHQLRPANVYGSGGPVDTAQAHAVYWISATGALYKSLGDYGFGTSIYIFPPASGMAPTLRKGACLSWDGNVPGYWSGEQYNLRRPYLVLAGGVDAQGYSSGEVNVFQFSGGTGYYQGSWIAKLFLSTPVSYPSCGRLTMRAVTNPSADRIGIVVFGGSYGGVPQGTLQIVKTNQYAAFGIESYNLGSVLGPRWGAAIVDQQMWGYPSGSNNNWYIWGGTGDTGARQSWVDWLSVSCTTYSQNGAVPSGMALPASTWSYNAANGRTVMLVYGGRIGATYYSFMWYAEMDDANDRFTWTFLPAAVIPAARAAATLYCHEWAWDTCNLPNTATHPQGLYHMSGGFAGVTQYRDVWRATTHL